MVRTVFVLAVALVVPVPSFTVHTMVKVPASVNVGVPVIVAVRGEGPATCAVNVNDAGFPACVIVRLFAAATAHVCTPVITLAPTPSPASVAGAEIAGV